MNYEFPTLAAGIFGLMVTTLLTVFRVGLGAHSGRKQEEKGEGEEAETKDPKANWADWADADKETDLENGKVATDFENEKGATVISDVEIVPRTGLSEIQAQIEDADGITFTGPSGDIPTKISSTKAQAKPAGFIAQAKAQESEGGGVVKTSSKKSLKDRAVNPEVEVCKKTLKKLHKGRNMVVMPMRLWRAHHSEDSDGRTPSRHAKVAIDDAHHDHHLDLKFFDCVFRTMPLWLTVLLLILTRIEPIGLKSALRLKEPTIVDGDMGTLGHLSISAVGRFSLKNILGTNIVSRQQSDLGRV